LSKRDLLQVVDAAYIETPDEQDWLKALLCAAAPALDQGLGVCASTFSLRDSALQEQPIITGFAETGAGGALRQLVEDMHREAPPALLRSAYASSMVSTLSDFLNCDLAGRPDMRSLIEFGGRDVMGVVAFDPSGFGIVLSPLLPATGSLPPLVQRAWLRVVAHLNAGLRLRASPERNREAVLDHSGKIYDARGLALDKSARAALRQAARAIDRARSLRVSDPNEALELRAAVIGGQWSLVDQFDADGRHFLVACRNPVGAGEPAPLSEREQQATALAAQGYSNKRIASVLGLSTGSVSTLLFRASRKWGAGSRTRLIQAWQERQDEPPPSPGSSGRPRV
jgi:DNA-binding CsgD family transcriptional regulator